jgi:hypothetical protein
MLIALSAKKNDDLLVNTSNGSAIFTSGIDQNGPALLALYGPIRVPSATSIYDAASNSIYSLSTGAKTWSRPAEATVTGAVAGTLVVFPSYLNRLISEPY